MHSCIDCLNFKLKKGIVRCKEGLLTNNLGQEKVYKETIGSNNVFRIIYRGRKIKSLNHTKCLAFENMVD